MRTRRDHVRNKPSTNTEFNGRDPNFLRRKQCESSDSDSNTENDKHKNNKKEEPQKYSKSRKKFRNRQPSFAPITTEDEQEMMNYLIRTNTIHEALRVDTWQQMVAEEILTPDRTALSLLIHFSMTLIHKYKHYTKSKSILAEFKKLWRTYIGDHMISTSSSEELPIDSLIDTSSSASCSSSAFTLLTDSPKKANDPSTRASKGKRTSLSSPESLKSKLTTEALECSRRLCVEVERLKSPVRPNEETPVLEGPLPASEAPSPPVRTSVEATSGKNPKEKNCQTSLPSKSVPLESPRTRAFKKSKVASSKSPQPSTSANHTTSPGISAPTASKVKINFRKRLMSPSPPRNKLSDDEIIPETPPKRRKVTKTTLRSPVFPGLAVIEVQVKEEPVSESGNEEVEVIEAPVESPTRERHDQDTGERQVHKSSPPKTQPKKYKPGGIDILFDTSPSGSETDAGEKSDSADFGEGAPAREATPEILDVLLENCRVSTASRSPDLSERHSTVDAKNTEASERSSRAEGADKKNSGPLVNCRDSGSPNSSEDEREWLSGSKGIGRNQFLGKSPEVNTPVEAAQATRCPQVSNETPKLPGVLRKLQTRGPSSSSEDGDDPPRLGVANNRRKKSKIPDPSARRSSANLPGPCDLSSQIIRRKKMVNSSESSPEHPNAAKPRVRPRKRMIKLARKIIPGCTNYSPEDVPDFPELEASRNSDIYPGHSRGGSSSPEASKKRRREWLNERAKHASGPSRTRDQRSSDRTDPQNSGVSSRTRARKSPVKNDFNKPALPSKTRNEQSPVKVNSKKSERPAKTQEKSPIENTCRNSRVLGKIPEESPVRRNLGNSRVLGKTQAAPPLRKSPRKAKNSGTVEKSPVTGPGTSARLSVERSPLKNAYKKPSGRAQESISPGKNDYKKSVKSARARTSSKNSELPNQIPDKSPRRSENSRNMSQRVLSRANHPPPKIKNAGGEITPKKSTKTTSCKKAPVSFPGRTLTSQRKDSSPIVLGSSPETGPEPAARPGKARASQSPRSLSSEESDTETIILTRSKPSSYQSTKPRTTPKYLSKTPEPTDDDDETDKDTVIITRSPSESSSQENTPEPSDKGETDDDSIISISSSPGSLPPGTKIPGNLRTPAGTNDPGKTGGRLVSKLPENVHRGKNPFGKSPKKSERKFLDLDSESDDAAGQVNWVGREEPRCSFLEPLPSTSSGSMSHPSTKSRNCLNVGDSDDDDDDDDEVAEEQWRKASYREPEKNSRWERDEEDWEDLEPQGNHDLGHKRTQKDPNHGKNRGESDKKQREDLRDERSQSSGDEVFEDLMEHLNQTSDENQGHVDDLMDQPYEINSSYDIENPRVQRYGPMQDVQLNPMAQKSLKLLRLERRKKEPSRDSKQMTLSQFGIDYRDLQFSKEEDAAIVKGLIDYNLISKAFSETAWRQLLSYKIAGFPNHRGLRSLQKHFRKVLSRKYRSYTSDAKIIRQFEETTHQFEETERLKNNRL